MTEVLDFELDWERLKLWSKRHRKWWQFGRLTKAEISQYVREYPDIPKYPTKSANLLHRRIENEW